MNTTTEQLVSTPSVQDQLEHEKPESVFDTFKKNYTVHQAFFEEIPWFGDDKYRNPIGNLKLSEIDVDDMFNKIQNWLTYLYLSFDQVKPLRIPALTKLGKAIRNIPFFLEKIDNYDNVLRPEWEEYFDFARSMFIDETPVYVCMVKMIRYSCWVEIITGDIGYACKDYSCDLCASMYTPDEIVLMKIIRNLRWHEKPDSRVAEILDTGKNWMAWVQEQPKNRTFKFVNDGTNLIFLNMEEYRSPIDEKTGRRTYRELEGVRYMFDLQVWADLERIRSSLLNLPRRPLPTPPKTLSTTEYREWVETMRNGKSE